MSSWPISATDQQICCRHKNLKSVSSEPMVVHDTVPAWFESYLKSRKYYVQAEGSKSTRRPTSMGFLKGQSWAPNSMYCTPRLLLTSVSLIIYSTTILTTHNYTLPLRPTVMLMQVFLHQELNAVLQISTDG